MGAVILWCVSHTKGDKLKTVQHDSLFDINVRELNQDESKQISTFVEGKKAVLVVNLASGWGLTDKYYKQLVQMDKDLGGEGLQILGFPSNTFNQEKGTAKEIHEFARGKYGAEFPIFEKIEVNGPKTHEAYNYLRTNSELFDTKSNVAKPIPWSWSKFLVDSNGKVVKFYPTII